MLSAEQRALWDAEIERSRGALASWPARAPESYSATTEARVAAAEQLAACEELLADIEGAPFYVDLAGASDVVQIRRHLWRDFHERATELLDGRPERPRR
jgi:hypothetical protein